MVDIDGLAQRIVDFAQQSGRTFIGVRSSAQQFATGGNTVEDVILAAAKNFAINQGPHAEGVIENWTPQAVATAIQNNLGTVPPKDVGNRSSRSAAKST